MALCYKVTWGLSYWLSWTTKTWFSISVLIVTPNLIRVLRKVQAWITLTFDLSLTFFDLLMSLSVKCHVAVEFLLVSKSKHLSISHGLAVICIWKVSYHLATISDKPCKKSNHFFLGQVNKVEWLNTFMRMSITIKPRPLAPWVSGLVVHFVQIWPDSELLSHSAELRL